MMHPSFLDSHQYAGQLLPALLAIFLGHLFSVCWFESVTATNPISEFKERTGKYPQFNLLDQGLNK